MVHAMKVLVILVSALLISALSMDGQNATKIQGTPVATTKPTDGQALVYNDTQKRYLPGTVAAGSTNATQLQGRDVDSAAPSDGNVLGWDNTASTWKPVEVLAAGDGTDPAGIALYETTANGGTYGFAIFGAVDQSTDGCTAWAGTPGLGKIPKGSATTANYTDSSGKTWTGCRVIEWADDATGSTPTIATQAEAEAGTENTTMMTPLRVAQAIDAQAAGAPTWTASATSGWHYPFGYGPSSAAIAALSGKLNWHRFTPTMNLVFTKVYSEYASAGYTAIAITNADGSAAVTNGTCRTNAGAGGACVFPGTVTLTAGTTYIFATTSDANGGLRMGDTGASWVEYSASNYKTFGTMAHTATGSGATLAVTIPFTPGGDATSPKVPVIGFGN